MALSFPRLAGGSQMAGSRGAGKARTDDGDVDLGMHGEAACEIREQAQGLKC